MVPPAVSTMARILTWQKKNSEVTSLRPNVHRNNPETSVAINRSWFMYRKCKWNNPFCKTELRALDLGHVIHLFMFELSRGLFRIGDGWARHNHSLGYFCLNPFLLFFFFPSPSTHVANEVLATHQPKFSLLSPDVGGYVAWAQALGWNRWIRLCNGGVCFPLMIYRKFCCRHVKGRVTMQLNCWGGQPSTTWQHFLASQATLQALQRLWLDVGACLDVL